MDDVESMIESEMYSRSFENATHNRSTRHSSQVQTASAVNVTENYSSFVDDDIEESFSFFEESVL